MPKKIAKSFVTNTSGNYVRLSSKALLSVLRSPCRSGERGKILYALLFCEQAGMSLMRMDETLYLETIYGGKLTVHISAIKPLTYLFYHYCRFFRKKS